jgi:hypothetical protein
MKVTSVLLAVGLLSGPALAQINYTVGPATVPLGSRVSITLSNDNPTAFGISEPLFEVFDDKGVSIYEPIGPVKSVLMGPHGWVTFYWDLVDKHHVKVPPGDYTVAVRFDYGVTPTSFPVTVVPEGAGLVFEGTATIHPPLFGSDTRNFRLQSPSDAGMPYLLLASASSTVGFPTCGGVLPLDADPLCLMSLDPNAVFQSAFGVLNSSGASKAPTFKLPQMPTLVGLPVESAYAVLDPAAPCLVHRISNLHSMTIH